MNEFVENLPLARFLPAAALLLSLEWLSVNIAVDLPPRIIFSWSRSSLSQFCSLNGQEFGASGHDREVVE